MRDIFRDAMANPFREQLIELWEGKFFQQREVLNYSLEGAVLHLHLQFSLLPGREKDWSLVQVALTDITARKKAENYLEFLGKHDVLTRLYNRSFYVDELDRLERQGPFPMTAIVIDVNELKEVNDQLGHAAGDALLRRVGDVLRARVAKPCQAARVGGDEFIILMPGASQRDGEAMVADILKHVEASNQRYGKPSLEPGDRRGDRQVRRETGIRRQSGGCGDVRVEEGALRQWRCRAAAFAAPDAACFDRLSHAERASLELAAALRLGRGRHGRALFLLGGGDPHAISIDDAVGRGGDHPIVRLQSGADLDLIAEIARDRDLLEQDAIVGVDGRDPQAALIEDQRADGNAEQTGNAGEIGMHVGVAAWHEGAVGVVDVSCICVVPEPTSTARADASTTAGKVRAG